MFKSASRKKACQVVSKSNSKRAKSTPFMPVMRTHSKRARRALISGSSWATCPSHVQQSGQRAQRNTTNNGFPELRALWAARSRLSCQRRSLSCASEDRAVMLRAMAAKGANRSRRFVRTKQLRIGVGPGPGRRTVTFFIDVACPQKAAPGAEPPLKQENQIRRNE